MAKVRYELKTPYRGGTTHVIFNPLNFIAFAHEDCVFMPPDETRLVTLVLRPRVNRSRFPGVSPPIARIVRR